MFRHVSRTAERRPPLMYIVRFFAFLLILAAIINKNRRG